LDLSSDRILNERMRGHLFGFLSSARLSFQYRQNGALGTEED